MYLVLFVKPGVIDVQTSKPLAEELVGVDMLQRTDSSQRIVHNSRKFNLKCYMLVESLGLHSYAIEGTLIGPVYRDLCLF